VEGEAGVRLTVRFQTSLSKPLITMDTQTKSKFVNFSEVKASVNITQILDHFDLLEDLKKEPTGYAGSCPFCDSSSPRPFRASEDKNCFNCLSCKTGGNILDFVVEMEDCTIREAALRIQEWFGLETKSSAKRSPRKKKIGRKKARGEPDAPAEPKKPKPLGFTLELDDQHEWFDEEGIDPATVVEFGLGFCGKGTMQGCIAFPVYDESHELTGYVGYDLSKSEQDDEYPWRFPKQLDTSRLVYNYSRTDPTGEGELVLARDPLDLILRWQDGEKRIVALLNDTISAAQVKILESLV
jgi:hypothetical protein